MLRYKSEKIQNILTVNFSLLHLCQHHQIFLKISLNFEEPCVTSCSTCSVLTRLKKKPNRTRTHIWHGTSQNIIILVHGGFSLLLPSKNGAESPSHFNLFHVTLFCNKWEAGVGPACRRRSSCDLFVLSLLEMQNFSCNISADAVWQLVSASFSSCLRFSALGLTSLQTAGTVVESLSSQAQPCPRLSKQKLRSSTCLIHHCVRQCSRKQAAEHHLLSREAH